MADEDKDYSIQSKAVIAKKEREIQKAKDLADAFKNELHKAHKGFLSDVEVKDKVRQEILNGVRGRDAGVDPRIRLRGTEGVRDDFEPDSVVGNEDPYWKREE